MNASIKLGRIWGIPIGLHFSWFLIFGLVTWLAKVEPTTELLAALQLMDEAKVSQLPVVDNNQVLGLLSRDSIFNYLRVRSELGV